MDFSRAFLLSLGIVIHAALLSKDPNLPGWSACCSGMVAFIHSFRLQAFFTVAGFFSAMMLAKYGASRFLHRRLWRLVIPMVVVGITFNSLLHAVSPQPFGLPFSFTDPAYWLGGSWMAHLWFLCDLSLMVLATYGLARIWPGFSAWLGRIPLAPWMILLGTPVLRALLSRIAWRIPSSPWPPGWWLFFDDSTFLGYLAFYGAGLLLFHHQNVLDRLIASIPLHLLGMGCYAICLILPTGTFPGLVYLREFLSTVYALGMVFCLFAFSRRFFSWPSHWVRRFSESSYTIYLLHFPVMGLLALTLQSLFPIPVYLLFFLLILVVGLWCYAVHRLLIERIPILAFAFNGILPGTKARNHWNKPSIIPTPAPLPFRPGLQQVQPLPKPAD